MGIKNLGKLLQKYAPDTIEIFSINHYKGEIIAMDTSILIYQYITAIRNTGMDLTNSKGEITTHIHAIINKTICLLERNIKPVYIFDGKAPDLKKAILDKRHAERKKAAEKMKKMDGDQKTKFFKRSTVVTREQMEECKEILAALGIPAIQSIEEADSQCANLAKMGLVSGVSSEDMDILTFGTPKLLRNFSACKGVKEISLDNVLSELEITQDQFIDLCILLGCDYCPTIKGVGMVRALSVIKEYGSIENFLKNSDKVKKGTYKVPDNFHYKKARKYFKHPPVHKLGKKDIKYKKPKWKTLKKLLVEKYEFDTKKVDKQIAKLKKCLS